MTQDHEHTPEAAPEAAPEQETAVPEAAPEARVAELEAEVARLKDQLLRALAETENTRRRLEQQAEERSRYAIANFARDVLAVADNLRRALDSVNAEARAANPVADTLATGVELTERELKGIFERYSIRQVPAQGRPFDPNLHQAMMEIEDVATPAGTVVMVMQPGYTIHDRLLRAAMVGVAKGGPKPQPGTAGDEGADEDDTGRVDTRA